MTNNQRNLLGKLSDAPGGLTAQLTILVLWAAIALMGMWLLGGCSLKNKSMDEQRQTLQMWTDFAKSNNVSFIGQASYVGRGGLYFQQLYGIDLGVSANATFMYQPSTGQAWPPPPPVTGEDLMRIRAGETTKTTPPPQ